MAVVFADAEAAPHANLQTAAVQHVIEGDVSLGNHDRVVPREHHHHRAHVDALCAAGEVRQELRWIVDHCVRREVVFYGPQ